MLLIFLGIKFDAIRNLLVGEPRNNLPRLSVPQLDIPIIRCRKKLVACIVKANVSNSLSMAKISSDAAPILVYFPDLLELDD